MPGFSFLAAVLTGVGAWSARALSNSLALGLLLVGLVATGAGAAADLDWLLKVGVFAVAVLLGVAIGRIIPPSSAAMLVLLGLLSLADIIWIATGGGSATGWVDDIANFSVQVGESSSSIGTVDLVLAAMITTHWLQRGAGVWLALAAAPIGMVASNVYVALGRADNLPLVPFITLGWLVTEAWHRRSESLQQSRT